MHLLKLILLFSPCIGMSANAQTPYDSFAPETSCPMLDVEALSREKCAQDFFLDTTLLVAMIDRQQERILLMDMSNGSIVAYAPLTDNKCHWLSPDPLLDKYPNGNMLPLGSKDGKYHPLSTGCLIIAPSRKGKIGWNEFNNQLQGIKKAFLKLTRQ